MDNTKDFELDKNNIENIKLSSQSFFLLENIADAEDLDQIIKDTKCLILLNLLLSWKFMNNATETKKISFSIHHIYRNDVFNIKIKSSALKKALQAQETNEEYFKAALYLKDDIDKIRNRTDSVHVSYMLQVLLELAKIQNVRQILLDIIDKSILDTCLLNLCSDNVPNLNDLLYEFLNLFKGYHHGELLKSLFKNIQHNNNLSILCTSFDIFIPPLLTDDTFSLLKEIEYWECLQDSLLSKKSQCKKYSLHLLTKSIDIIHKNSEQNIILPECVYLKGAAFEFRKMWDVFFSLLEITQEKHFHLVGPALKMLPHLDNLHPTWQLLLYKKLLCHSQNTIIYSVVIHILKNKSSPSFITDIFEYILPAINKNEYSKVSLEVFDALKDRLDREDFSIISEKVFNLYWNPISMWCITNSLFIEQIKLSLGILQKTITCLQRLPHIFIRESCINLIIKTFFTSFKWNSTRCNIIDILKVLYNVGIKDFEKFISDNKTNILLYKEDIHTYFSIGSKNSLTDFYFYFQVIHNLGLQEENDFGKKLQFFSVDVIDIFYLTFFKDADISDIRSHLVKRLNNITNASNSYIFPLIELACNESSNEELIRTLHDKSVVIVNDMSNKFDVPQKLLALKILTSDYILEDWYDVLLDNYINMNEKIEINICSYLIDLYFIKYKNRRISLDQKRLQEITVTLLNVINLDNEDLLFKIVEKLDLILGNNHDHPEAIIFADSCLKRITRLSINSLKKGIIAFINHVYRTEFFSNVYFIKYVLDWNNIILEIIKLHSEVAIQFLKMYHILIIENMQKLDIFIDMITELLYTGIIINKTDRHEYLVCQEIQKQMGKSMKNPNTLKMYVRLLSVESLLKIIERNKSNADEIADKFAINLVDRYRRNYGKRYFPDSQIHIEKLRTIQVLLLIEPFTKVSRDELIMFIIDSFCEEIHQPCVKQLMQWLLIRLMTSNLTTYFGVITDKMNAVTSKQSSIIAFIPVLYHLNINSKQSDYLAAMDLLVPWTMGAHFKLRLYSQFAILKLYEKAASHNYADFVQKYDFLYNSVKKVVKACEEQFLDTLKADVEFFNLFDPKLLYTIETIYVNIPKLNNVTPSEWENVLTYDFTNIASIITINNDVRSFSNAANSKSTNFNNKEEIPENYEMHHNLQRKIIPWKVALEENKTEKTVGDFVLIASLVDKSSNLGGISRTCEIFGIQTLVLNDVKIVNDKEFKSLSMSSEIWLNPIEVKKDGLKNFIEEIKDQGYRVIGAEQTSESIQLNTYKFPKKTVLLLGNEKHGIPAPLIPLLDDCVEIPQCGLVRSLNVHVAAAMFIWEYAKQHCIQ